MYFRVSVRSMKLCTVLELESLSELQLGSFTGTRSLAFGLGLSSPFSRGTLPCLDITAGKAVPAGEGPPAAPASASAAAPSAAAGGGSDRWRGEATGQGASFSRYLDGIEFCITQSLLGGRCRLFGNGTDRSVLSNLLRRLLSVARKSVSSSSTSHGTFMGPVTPTISVSPLSWIGKVRT